MDNHYLWLKDGQTELSMIESPSDRKWKKVKVVRETDACYFMENDDRVYKKTACQVCKKHPHLYKGEINV